MAEQTPEAEAGPRQQCGPCIVIKVIAFAVFTAYIAADLAMGGKLTGTLLSWLPKRGEP